MWLQVEMTAATILPIQHAHYAAQLYLLGWQAERPSMVGTLPWLLLSQQPVTHQPFTPCHDNIIAFEQTPQLQITQYDMLQILGFKSCRKQRSWLMSLSPCHMQVVETARQRYSLDCLATQELVCGDY